MTAAAPDRLAEWFGKIEKLEEPKRTQMLRWVRQEYAREKSLRENRNVADLARSLDPSFVVTEANALIGQAIEDCMDERRGRLLITMPPQEGKTTLGAVHAPVRGLQKHPEWRVMLASFSSILAEESSVAARALIQKHGTGAIDPLTGIADDDQLGLALASDKAAAAQWRIQGHRGGMVAVGLGGTISGRPADLLIIDDPIKGMEASDSDATKNHVIEGFQGDLTTRLSAGASIILIQTRWAEDDLAGWILKREESLPPEKRRWRHINIPAQAEEGLYDSLGREPGTWLESARLRTPDDWQETKDLVGTRVWTSLYQGAPSPLEGGLVKKAWLDRHRLTLPPVNPVLMGVGVDPADSGKGDDAGVVAASVGTDGYTTMIVDRSKPMTSDQWATAAVKLAVEVGASLIVVESFAARETYRRTVQEAIDKIKPPHEIEIVPWPPVGSGRGGGDSLARSTSLIAGLENGRVRLAGKHPEWEKKTTSWQSGQHQPDGMAALTCLHDELMARTGQVWDIATPFDSSSELDGDWMDQSVSGRGRRG